MTIEISRDTYKLKVLPVLEEVAYSTSDGRLFLDEQEAEDHQIDLLGEALDGFLPHDDRGRVTRSDRHNLLMKQLSDDKLVSKIKELYNIIKWAEVSKYE